MENQKNEQVIYLKDLLFVLLRGWRSLLIAAVALAVVFGGVKLYRGIQEITANNNAALEALPGAKAEYIRQLKAADEAIEAAEKEWDVQKEYMEESVYMRLDPKKFYQAEVTFFIQTDSADTALNIDKVLEQYVSTAQGNPFVTRIGKAVGEELRFIREVYDIKSDDETVTFRVMCSCVTEEMAEKVLLAIKSEMADAQEKIALIRGAHELLVIEEGIGKLASAELEQAQQEAKATLDALDANVEEAEAAKAAIEEPVAAITPKSQVIKSTLKYAIVGAVIGIAAVVAFLWLRHIAGGKVYSARVLMNVTGVKLLGCISGQPVKNPIDRWLFKLEGRETDDQEKRIKLVASDICNRCGEGKRLLVTGDGSEQYRKILVEALAVEMPSIHLVDEGSLLQEPAAMEALAVHDLVLLVEQCGSSSYARVERELEAIADYGKTLIGCVLLEA